MCGVHGYNCKALLNEVLKEEYPDCPLTSDWHLLGNGDCNRGVHNSEECGWDMVRTVRRVQWCLNELCVCV